MGQRVSLEETAKIKRPKKLQIIEENHRNQAIPVIFGGDYWTRTSGLMRVKHKAGRRTKEETAKLAAEGKKPMRADEELAQQTGESRSNIQKLVRLNNLTRNYSRWWRIRSSPSTPPQTSHI